MKLGRHWLLISVLMVLSLSGVSQRAVPELWGMRVHDEANVLSADIIHQLETQLRLFEDSTTNQIAILITPSLEGEPIEGYSMRVVERWKLGSQANDNGVLVLVAVNDREMRIEVGLGLEGVLTDAQCNRIIRNELAPSFRNGDYDEGLLKAVKAITQTIGGEYAAADGDEVDNMGWEVKLLVGLFATLVIGIFAGAGLFSQGYMTWVLYVFLMPFVAAFLGLIVGWWTFGVYLIVYPLLRMHIVSNPKLKAKLLKWESGGGSSSGGSRSSGGSSFSGGGGSFGGGGSSGSW